MAGVLGRSVTSIWLHPFPGSLRGGRRRGCKADPQAAAAGPGEGSRLGALPGP